MAHTLKMLFLLPWLSFLLVTAQAQSPLKNALQAMRYKIRAETGTNAYVVTYNAQADIYYSAFAGNSTYPLEAFDNQGKTVYSSEIGIDARGLWFNKKNNSLEGLAYPNKGKFSIPVNSAGLPLSLVEPKKDTSYIPNNQSIATSNEKNLFLFDGKRVSVVNPKSLRVKATIQLASMPVESSNLNYTTVGYTGVKNHELAFYDMIESKVYFTNLKGIYSGTSKLPNDAPEAQAFRFSYTNNLLWLYDAANRTWIAYRVF